MDRLLIIAGPTAVGKSAAGVELALRLNGSIISADSMQVYRGMDIGTAKVTKEEMRGVPHALIDIIEPAQEWNVVCFCREAGREAARITAQHRLPVLVGGTGFYIQALLYGIDFTDTQEDDGYRAQLRQIAQEKGTGVLHRMLEETDPEAAAAIHPNNVKRIIRALEYSRSTGEKISAHNEEQRRRAPAYDAVFFCLAMDRGRMYERIDSRVDRMMEQGLVEEVRMLRDRGLSTGDVSMQGLGYRQLLEWMDGKYTLEEAVRQIKMQTRHFAKRQLTWFRGQKDVIWVDADRYDSVKELADEMERLIRKRWPT